MGLCFTKQKYINLYLNQNSRLTFSIGPQMQNEHVRKLILSIPCRSYRDGHAILREILVNDLDITSLVAYAPSGSVACYLTKFYSNNTRGLNLLRPRLCFESSPNELAYGAYGSTYENARHNLKNRILLELGV